MALVDQPFADTFDFVRGRVAPYRDAAGTLASAPADVPRFDHDPDGGPLGLLVEGRPQTPFADKCVAKDGDWYAGLTASTVLHAFAAEDGLVSRRAWYAGPQGPRAIISGCLNAKGWHRMIAVVPGHLPNRGGEVRWRNAFWSLGGVVLVQPGTVLAAGPVAMLLEG